MQGNKNGSPFLSKEIKMMIMIQRKRLQGKGFEGH
jgi:hypothetical protein